MNEKAERQRSVQKLELKVNSICDVVSGKECALKEIVDNMKHYSFFVFFIKCFFFCFFFLFFEPVVSYK